MVAIPSESFGYTNPWYTPLSVNFLSVYTNVSDFLKIKELQGKQAQIFLMLLCVLFLLTRLLQ